MSNGLDIVRGKFRWPIGPYMSRLPGVNNLSKSDKFNPSIIQSIKVKYLIAKGKVKHLVAVSSNLGKDIMTNDTYIVYLVPAPWQPSTRHQAVVSMATLVPTNPPGHL